MREREGGREGELQRERQRGRVREGKLERVREKGGGREGRKVEGVERREYAKR